MRLAGSLRRMIYGAPSGGVQANRWMRKLFLPAALLPFLIGLAGLVLIELVVDPYALWSWGLTPKIADHRYPDLEWPLLLKVVAKQDHDLAMIGASTLMGASHDDLVSAFGATTKPVNLAYPYAAPADIKLVVDTVAAMPKMKRVVFIMDHSQMMGLGEKRLPAQLRERVFASDWAHAGDFRWDTLIASWHRIVDGVYDKPEWHGLKYPEFFANFSPITQQPRTLQRLRNAVARHRSDVLGGGIRSNCNKYPFIELVLVPALEKFRARDIKVDLVFPPYPYAGYYDLIDRRTSNDPFDLGPVYPQFMGFKKCVVDAADRFGPDVTVHAFDNDKKISGSIGNYNDSIHIIRPEIFKIILGKISDKNTILTKSNFEKFDHNLRLNVILYKL